MQVCSIVRACKDEHSTHLVEQIMKPINVVYCLPPTKARTKWDFSGGREQSRLVKYHIPLIRFSTEALYGIQLFASHSSNTRFSSILLITTNSTVY